MKPDNIIKASESFEVFFGVLRKAHNNAVASENQWAELAMFNLIEKAAELQRRLKHVTEIAK